MILKEENAKKNITVGIDIGGTKTLIGFVDPDGNILLEESIKTEHKDSAELYVKYVSEKINSFYEEKLNGYTIAGIGLAVPCGNRFTGYVENPSNFNWGNVDFIGLMKKYIDQPIILLNDAKAAAVGEHHYGKAKGMQNFIVITIGTGLGSGIVLNGELFYGQNSLAGELGHVSVNPNGRKCTCGKSGCLETYVSSNGLRRTALELMSHYLAPSELRYYNFDQIDSKKIFELAEKGDSLAIQVFDETSKILARGLSDAAINFDPEAFILCGGVVNSGDFLIQGLKKYFEENLLSMYRNRIQILKSDMLDGRAAVRGAAYLANKEFVCANNYKMAVS